ncbi:MAG: sigma-54-dependent transcriptional regulator [Deltaproteobacteria bacterium]
MFQILLVDDEPQLRFTIRKFLETRGYGILEADSCQSAIETCRNARPDAMVLDYNLPDGDALGLLPSLQEIQPEIPILILTAHATVDLAVRAMKLGAENFLTKPVELPTLHIVLERALENQRNRVKVAANESRIAREFLGAFLGQGEAIRRLANLAESALRTDGPVLIQGETGSGKGTLAMWLHNQGSRSKEAIVDLNCAGLSRELLESELFGHEKGAFTGAVTSKMGLLEIAHRGTVFLDEIGDADPMVQAKLLKVLEDKRFRRLGDVRDRHVDVRLIAATHHDLRTLIQENKFRSDLYFRISTVLLKIPPLRERLEDMPLISQTLLERIAANLKHAQIRLAPDALAALKRYSWPGNIRELRNVLERAALLCDGGTIHAGDLHFEFAGPATPAGSSAAAATDDTNLRLSDVERIYIQKIIQEENGRIERAAERLGVPRSSLYKKIKAMGILVSKYSSNPL